MVIDCKKLKLVLLFNFLLIGTLHAKPITKEELKKIQSKLKSAESLSVNFNHYRYSSLRKKKTKPHHGLAYFSKHGEFKWVQLSPTRVEFIFNGKELFQNFPEENRAVKYPATQEISRRYLRITYLVVNVESLFDEYDLEKADLDEKNKYVVVDLKPKTQQGDLVKISVGISLAQNFVKDIKLSYSDKREYEYEFTSPKFDTLGADTFSFVVPKNVKLETLQ